MQQLLQVVLSLPFIGFLAIPPSGLAIKIKLPNDMNNGANTTGQFQTMLMDIYKERSFESLLVMTKLTEDNPVADAIHRFYVPKVTLVNGHSFEFIRKFNAEILVLLIMSHRFQSDLMATAAQTLNYMRQARIFVVAWKVKENDINFKRQLLNSCAEYKMTNVLLKVVHTPEGMLGKIERIEPYALYHWKELAKDLQTRVYYPQHWWNMHNTTIITFTDLSMTLAYPFDDGHGGVKWSGHLARMVMLFAERFNASLQMYKSVEEAAKTHFAVVNQLVEDSLVDIPMTLNSGNDGKWLYRSYAFDLPEGVVMIPCAQPFTITEVFNVLLSVYFFGLLIICTLVFSMAHSMVDYFFDGLWQPTNFIFNDRILPGVLGQSFPAKNSPWHGLKLLYFLLFFSGLNIGTQFTANIQTLFTSPPYHRQIATFADLKNSDLKILILSGDVKAVGDEIAPIADSLLQTDDVYFYEENRNNFNTSTGYFLISMSWKILNRKQRYWSRNVFCAYKSMDLFHNSPYAFQLQPHSQYKEPLDWLIHHIHDFGLTYSWYSNTFGDMLRTKKISISDPNPDKGAQVLAVADLYGIWKVVALGLAVSCVIFLVELWLSHFQGRNCGVVFPRNQIMQM